MFERTRNTETLIDPINHTPRFQVNMFEVGASEKKASRLGGLCRGAQEEKEIDG
jgi:hypothetical protein